MTSDESNRSGLVQHPEEMQKPGLGDLAGEFFAALGVTEECYKALKVALHLDPKCGCADRRRWLNEMGDQLGIGGAVLKMARWLDRRKG